MDHRMQTIEFSIQNQEQFNMLSIPVNQSDSLKWVATKSDREVWFNVHLYNVYHTDTSGSVIHLYVKMLARNKS